MPEISFDSQESIPDGIREYAKQNDDGKWVVNVAPNEKLVEFRDNNIKFRNEIDQLKETVSRFSSVAEDPSELAEELSRLREVDQSVKDGKLKGNEAVAREVESRVKQMEESYKSQISELGGKLRDLDQKREQATRLYRQSVLDREVTNAVMSKDSGANPEALPDILSRAARTFTVNDKGNVVAMEGDAVLYGADGATPMSPREWLGKVIEEAPYLSKSSAGGGAAGNRGDEKFGGMSSDEFQKLSPQRRMEIARSKK